MSKIHDAKIKFLIVEDEADKREQFEKILYEAGADLNKLKSTGNSKDATAIIDEYEPDIILLDIKVPYNDGDVPETRNCKQILNNIELHNHRNENKIKTIVISGTIQDKGIQDLISFNKKSVAKFFDKDFIARDYENFKSELIRVINSLSEDNLIYEKPNITYTEVRNNTLKKLKTIDKLMFENVEKHIVQAFESISSENEAAISQLIIIRCGILVEDIIEQLNTNLNNLKGRKLNSFDELSITKNSDIEDENSIRRKLLSLSGRSWDNALKEYKIIGQEKISRRAAETATLVYRFRNHAGHSNIIDKKNENVFNDNKFTYDMAAFSISGVMPMIEDYITFKTKK